MNATAILIPTDFSSFWQLVPIWRRSFRSADRKRIIGLHHRHRTATWVEVLDEVERELAEQMAGVWFSRTDLSDPGLP